MNFTFYKRNSKFDLNFTPSKIPIMTDKRYGDFGAISKYYNKGRQGYPTEIIQSCLNYMQVKNPVILDLGCGTGIATRQLAVYGGKVIGVDSAAERLKAAERHHSRNIKYILAKAEELPFEDNSFDLVTSFSAFHWFQKTQALETKRVLKPNAAFCVINKKDIGSFKSDFKNIVAKAIGHELPNIKNNYDPEALLQTNGFRKVVRSIIQTIEYFSLEQALEQLQSQGFWPLVPEDKRDVVLKETTEVYSKKMKNGLIERELEIALVIGIK